MLQLMAARCMGVMSGTLFDGILNGIVPLAMKLGEEGAESTVEMRSGVMLGLKEVVVNGHKDKLSPHYDNIFECLLAGLCSTGPENEVVRNDAVGLFGHACEGMRKTYGDTKVIEHTIKELCARINQGDKAAVEAFRMLVTAQGLKTEKKEAVYKFAAGHTQEYPVKQLADEVSAAIEEGNALLAPSKQAKAKPKVEHKNKKDALSKTLDKALKKTLSKEKKEKTVPVALGPCPKKAGRCGLSFGHAGACMISDTKRAEIRAEKMAMHKR